MRTLAACLVLLAACAREEPIPLAPAPGAAADQRARWLVKPQVEPFVFDHFAQADLLSAANSRFGAVETNIASRPEVALEAAREARTYLELASHQAERLGQEAAARYQGQAAALLVQAAEAAKAGEAVKAQETLGAARRALDAAIEQANAALVGPPKRA